MSGRLPGLPGGRNGAAGLAAGGHGGAGLAAGGHGGAGLAGAGLATEHAIGIGAEQMASNSSRWLGPVLGVGAAVWLGRLSSVLLGGFAAYTVLSLVRQREPRIATLLEPEGGEHKDRSLEELIAEKERLEDLIAEAAARQSGQR